MKKINLKILLISLISSTQLNCVQLNQADFLVHYHPHKNVQELVKSKEKSDLSYKELMQQFGRAYSMIQKGVIEQDKVTIEIGLDSIDTHPVPKEKPWSIISKDNQEAFKASLLYYDNQLHNNIIDIKESLKTNNWILINQKVFDLSNQCISCHITWKDNTLNN